MRFPDLPGARLGAVVAGVMLTVCFVATDPASADTSTPVSLSFSDAVVGEPITVVTNDSAEATTQAVVTAHGGSVSAVSAGASGPAARFPSYNGSSSGPRAVIAVTNSGSTDVLGPGASDFVFGADVRLDTANRGTSYDNGNNIVQRGLGTDVAQFKLQVDRGRFSCFVKGDAGARTVKSPVPVAPGTLYRATCRRAIESAGERVIITVAKVAADGSLGAPTTTASKPGPVGNLSFAFATPLSVGGKLADSVTIFTASDQFNGVIDNAFLTTTASAP